MKKIVIFLLLLVLSCTKKTETRLTLSDPVTPPIPVKIDSSVSVPLNVVVTHSFRMCTIKWSDAKSASPIQGYRIYRDTVDHPKNLIVELSANDLKYQDTGLLIDKKYYYSVTAFNKYKEGPASFSSAITDIPIIGSQYVGFSFQNQRFTNLQQTVSFKNEPTQWDGTPDKSGIFIQLYNWTINEPNLNTSGFYYGFQTNLYPTGKRGFIFSRWGTTDLKYTKSPSDGWAVGLTAAQSGEGAFISVRKSYNWGTGTYVVTLNKDSSDVIGDWYSIYVSDSKGKDYMGSLRFDKSPNGSGILSGGGPFTEIYSRIGNTPIPNWNITIDKVLADGQLPIHSNSICNGLPMNISSINNVVHLDMGYYALRLNDDGDLW